MPIRYLPRWHPKVMVCTHRTDKADVFMWKKWVHSPASLGAPQHSPRCKHKPLPQGLPCPCKVVSRVLKLCQHPRDYFMDFSGL